MVAFLILSQENFLTLKQVQQHVSSTFVLRCCLQNLLLFVTKSGSKYSSMPVRSGKQAVDGDTVL